MWQPSICLVFRRTMSLSHMLRFASYDAEGGADTAPLRNVVLYDKDEVVVGGRVLHKNGLIQCEREGRGATGLGLLYDVGEPGDLCLRTEAELMGVKNFGMTSLLEIKEKLTQMGLSLRQLEA